MVMPRTNDLVSAGEPDHHAGRRERLKFAHRQAILDAGVRVLGAGVCDSVAVDRIAAQAGVAKGTVYNYFADKAALVEAIAQSVEARTIERIERAMQDLPSAAARLAAALAAMFEIALLHPDEAVILDRRISADCTYQSGLAALLMRELQRGKFSRLQASGAIEAALILHLSAMSAATRLFVSKRGGWRINEAHALISHCLVALGVDDEQAGAQASAALLRLL